MRIWEFPFVSPTIQGLSSLPRSTEFCWAFACLFCFPTLLLGFRATEGGASPGKEWRLEEDADHTNSATVHITTGSTNEDHICLAWHKRRPSQSQAQTLAKVGEWWETLGIPCAKDSERMGRVCIFKDSCQRQEIGEGVSGRRNLGVLEVEGTSSMLNGVEGRGERKSLRDWLVDSRWHLKRWISREMI